MELDDKTHTEIVKLAEKADLLMQQYRYDEAIMKFNEALQLVPPPINRWEASIWLYTGIGDAYFFKKEYSKAKEYFFDSINLPGGFSNPFVLLRLGQSLLECGDVNKAKEYLLRAYMLEGKDVFEDEDKKYFELIK